MTQPEIPGKAASPPWLAREIGATLALSGPIVATNIAVNFMTTTDVMLLGWLSPRALAAGARENAEIVALALSFLRVAAIFQIFDGAQAALANMLRGVNDSRWPMMMALIGYWAIGAPIGLVLGFSTPLRGLGLWIGLACGLAAVALQLLWRWRGRERRGFF